MDGWSVALLAVAGYVAVTALVRLMIRHRDRLLGQFRRKMRAAGTRPALSRQNEEQPTQESKAA